jgi:GNAT superfamily N-acetyltransferase
MVAVAALAPAEFDAAVPDLAEVLSLCVEGGAGVSFLQPFPPEAAARWWRSLSQRVHEGSIVVLTAREGAALLGTVQLHPAPQPNQPHRAEVAKLLVHPGARNRGIAEALMRRLEQEALARGRWLLTLDTASGAADRLYRRLGWNEVGRIPDYALWPDGRLSDTTVFYKRLG